MGPSVAKVMEDPVAVQADGACGVCFAKTGAAASKASPLPGRQVQMAAPQEAKGCGRVGREGKMAVQWMRRVEDPRFQPMPPRGLVGDL